MYIMDCTVLYNVTESSLTDMFQVVTNSNYVTAALTFVGLVINSIYYSMVNNRLTRISNSIYAPPQYMYSEQTRLRTT